MGRLSGYVMNSRKGFGLVERGLYKTLALFLNNTCTARVPHLHGSRQHLYGSRSTLARLASDTCVLEMLTRGG